MSAVISPGLAKTPSKALKPSVRMPAHPERTCWGCDLYCAADNLGCANGSIRTPHPRELFGDDWEEWFEATDAAREAAG